VTHWRSVIFLGLVLVVLGSSGCGSSKVLMPATQLHGKVIVDGRPVSTGVVTAYRGGSKVMETSIEPDGSYGFANPPGGQYALTVTATDAPTPYGRAVRLPAKYADPSASGLTATVADDQVNTQDLLLRTR
jgi:hypothetical protein